jgi:hypothetical protein
MLKWFAFLIDARVRELESRVRELEEKCSFYLALAERERQKTDQMYAEHAKSDDVRLENAFLRSAMFDIRRGEPEGSRARAIAETALAPHNPHGAMS